MLVLLSSRAEAKPTLYVSVDMSKAGIGLRDAINFDVAAQQLTAEQFIATQFCDAFNNLGMFTFEVAKGTTPVDRTIKLVVEGNWPEEDVRFWIISSGVKLQKPFELFWKWGCGRDNDAKPAGCEPASFSQGGWYQDVFANLIKAWPTGLFKNVQLTKTAKLDADGLVYLREKLDEFGDIHPTAIFAIDVGNEPTREFALCKPMTDGGTYHALGRDQSTRPTIVPPSPYCGAPKISPPLSYSGIGTVTLARGYLQ